MKSPPAPLMPLDDAVARVVDCAKALATGDQEWISTFDAWGRVLAQDVHAELNVPPADNTSMDG